MRQLADRAPESGASRVRADLVAGLTTAAVVIPKAMAYATVAGLPVEVGLYTCMLPMLVYALLGGSRSLSISTTSTIAILAASALSTLPSSRVEDGLLRDAFTLTTLVGLCLLAMRLFRLGSLVEQISPATLSGVKAGVGLTVAATQLPALLGIEATHGLTDVLSHDASLSDVITEVHVAPPSGVAPGMPMSGAFKSKSRSRDPRTSANPLIAIWAILKFVMV